MLLHETCYSRQHQSIYTLMGVLSWFLTVFPVHGGLTAKILIKKELQQIPDWKTPDFTDYNDSTEKIYPFDADNSEKRSNH